MVLARSQEEGTRLQPWPAATHLVVGAPEEQRIKPDLGGQQARLRGTREGGPHCLKRLCQQPRLPAANSPRKEKHPARPVCRCSTPHHNHKHHLGG